MGWPGSFFLSGYAPVAGREASPLTGIQGPVWAGPWVVFEPLYLHATEGLGLRDGIWLANECLLP